jgi:hypothetical protein
MDSPSAKSPDALETEVKKFKVTVKRKPVVKTVEEALAQEFKENLKNPLKVKVKVKKATEMKEEERKRINAIQTKIREDNRNKHYAYVDAVAEAKKDEAKPYFFPTKYDPKTQEVLYRGMVRIITALLKMKTIKTGDYGIEVAYHRPVEDTELYFDLVIKTDFVIVKNVAKTLLPPEGEEYGGKVDIQMYPVGWTPEGKNQNYLRLTLNDEEDEKESGHIWSTHYRGEFGRSDNFDKNYDGFLELAVRIAWKNWWSHNRVEASKYFTRLNEPLWKVLEKRLSKYIN